MICLHYLGQMGAIYVHINFGSGNAFMPQHLLYGSKIGTIFEQMSGKGMPEGMRANCFFETNLLSKRFNDSKDHRPG